jgi:hypothetical protein
MKYQILDDNRLVFFNTAGEQTGEMFVSSSGDFFITPTSGSNRDIIIGDRETVGDVEIGLPSSAVALKLMGGGTLSANGNTLNIGDPNVGDNVVIHNVTSSLNINGTTRTLFTSASIAYDGSLVSSVTQSFVSGLTQKTKFNYSGDNVSSVIVSGSDSLNKIYTLYYDGSNVSEIRVT